MRQKLISFTPADLRAGWRTSRSQDGYTCTADPRCESWVTNTEYKDRVSSCDSRAGGTEAGVSPDAGDLVTCCAAAGDWAVWRTCGSRCRCRVSLQCGCGCVGPGSWSWQTTWCSGDICEALTLCGSCRQEVKQTRRRGRYSRLLTDCFWCSSLLKSLQQLYKGAMWAATKYKQLLTISIHFLMYIKFWLNICMIF